MSEIPFGTYDRADAMRGAVAAQTVSDEAVDRALQAWFKDMPPIEEIEALGGYMGSTIGEHRADMRATLEAVAPFLQPSPIPAGAPVGYVNLYRAEDGELYLGGVGIYPSPEAEWMEFAGNAVGVGVVYLRPDHQPTPAEVTGREHATGDAEGLVENVAQIIDPHSWMPDNSGDDLTATMIANGKDTALGQARRVLAFLRSLPTSRPPVAPAPVEDAERDAGLVETIAQMIWHRFADGSVEVWDDEIHKAEYRDAASDILSRTRQSTPVSPADETAGLREALIVQKADHLVDAWGGVWEFEDGSPEEQLFCERFDALRRSIYDRRQALASKPDPNETAGLREAAQKALKVLQDVPDRQRSNRHKTVIGDLRQALASKPAPTQNGEDA